MYISEETMQCKVCVVQSLHSGNKGGLSASDAGSLFLSCKEGIDDKNPNQLLLHTIVNGVLKRTLADSLKKK